jgi:hypothetical protein
MGFGINPIVQVWESVVVYIYCVISFFSSHKICNTSLMLHLSKGWLKVDWNEYPPRAHVMFHSNLSFSHCIV